MLIYSCGRDISFINPYKNIICLSKGDRITRDSFLISILILKEKSQCELDAIS